MKSKSLKVLTFILGGGCLVGQALASNEYIITIKDHQFSPQEIVVPANQKVKLKIQNMDNTPEEFESEELDREKIVAANSSVVIFVGPLAPGSYPFIGEFNPETAKGVIKAE